MTQLVPHLIGGVNLCQNCLRITIAGVIIKLFVYFCWLAKTPMLDGTDTAADAGSSNAAESPANDNRTQQNGAEELSAERRAVLEHFQEVTGFNDETTCRSILEAVDWHLEAAVTQCLHLASGAQLSPPAASQPSSSTSTAVANTRAVAAGSGGVVSWLYGLLSWSTDYLLSTLWEIWRLCWSIVRGPPALEPAVDVRQFVEHFQSVYGDCHPQLFDGSYRQALASAKQQLCFLLVYLHSWRSDECDQFCRQLFCRSELVDFCRSEQLVVWACSVDRSEGARVSRALHETGYPFVAVIGVCGEQRRMSVVGRLQGSLQCGHSAAGFVTRLRRITGDNEAWLVAARADRHQRQLDRQLREQQDADYLRSLQVDQLKERQKAERQQLELEQRQQAELQLEQERLAAERLQQLKQQLFAALPEPPGQDVAASAVCRLSIKLPCGERIERRVSITDSLSVLYFLVFCHPQAPVHFDITLNYPRRALNCQPSVDPMLWVSEPSRMVDDLARVVNDPSVGDLASAGLGRSEVVYVTDLDA